MAKINSKTEKISESIGISGLLLTPPTNEKKGSINAINARNALITEKRPIVMDKMILSENWNSFSNFNLSLYTYLPRTIVYPTNKKKSIIPKTM
ncbi:MAG: hypothetical protein WAX07_09210 [Candidatus Altiarchaeia archaeon]